MHDDEDRRSATLTTGDAARELRVCEDTVRRLAARGVLPFTRTTSGLRLFSLRDVRRVAAQRAGKT